MKKIIEVFRKNLNVIFYSGSSIFVTFAQLIGTIISMKYIIPKEMGIWKTVSLFQTYSLVLQAGIINGLNRELPFHLGAGDENKAVRLAGTAELYTLASSIIVLIIGSIYALSMKENMYVYTGVIVTAISSLTFYQNYLTSTFRSKDSFKKLAYVEFARAGLILFTIPLIIYYKYIGFICRSLIVVLVTTIFYHKIKPLKTNRIWDKASLGILLKVGLPIFILAYLNSTSLTFDRILLLKYKGAIYVGYYAIGQFIYEAFKVIPLSVATYIYPRMTYEYGQNHNGLMLWNKAWKLNLIMFILLSIITILCWSIIPILINKYFPNYSEGINSSRILMVSVIFWGASIGASAITSIKTWKWIIILNLGGAILNIIFISLGIKYAADPLIGVSTGLLVSSVFYCILSNILTYKATHNNNFAKYK